MQWDPAQYSHYSDERGRPFVDLISRIAAESPASVVDLGCGPGNLTALLPRRWPQARITGLDSSPEMIERARANAGISFDVQDIESWTPTGDVVISNAALQWVPTHSTLLRQWCRSLAPGSWLAWQVAGNFDAPSHALMRALASSERWRSSLDGVLRHDAVLSPAAYAQLLLDEGWSADVWETTYVHLLAGVDPVLDWVRGTGLRPILQALSAADAEEFTEQYAAQLRAAYPSGPHATMFEFRRIFAVGHKPSSHPRK